MFHANMTYILTLLLRWLHIELFLTPAFHRKISPCLRLNETCSWQSLLKYVKNLNKAHWQLIKKVWWENGPKKYIVFLCLEYMIHEKNKSITYRNWHYHYAFTISGLGWHIWPSNYHVLFSAIFVHCHFVLALHREWPCKKENDNYFTLVLFD